MHGAMGFMIASLACAAFYHVGVPYMFVVLLAILAVIAAALWKELSDYEKKGKFNWWDILATLAVGAIPIIGFIGGIWKNW